MMTIREGCWLTGTVLVNSPKRTALRRVDRLDLNAVVPADRVPATRVKVIGNEGVPRTRKVLHEIQMLRFCVAMT
jgi:hypothetical protein